MTATTNITKEYSNYQIVYKILVFALSSIFLLTIFKYTQSMNITRFDDINVPKTHKIVKKPLRHIHNITYDHKSIIIDGKRQLLIAGAIHYPRSTPGMWPHLIKKSKEAGINTIDTYVFWNVHEPVKRHYDFEIESANLPYFLQLIKDAGLYVNLRIGPYVCAEWSFGGLPIWLKDEVGLNVRTWNQPFMKEMEIFIKKLLLVIHPFIASNGGNIILMQIENEYSVVERDYGSDGTKYIMWAADLAIGVPWIMCLNDNVPTVISTCNGFYCDNWIGSRPKKNEPPMFTELWTGWFQLWGQLKPTRPMEDIAFSLARWVARGGAYSSYYMWHGGTNFKHYGSTYQITSYDYDAPLNEYGFPTDKYYHLAKFHSILNAHADVILEKESHTIFQDWGKEIYIYGDIKLDMKVIVFLCNVREHNSAMIEFEGLFYHLPKWTVQILIKEGKNFKSVFITSKPQNYSQSFSGNSNPKTSKIRDSLKNMNISWVQENHGIWNSSNAFHSNHPMEHINLTKDNTEYLWYQLSNVPIVINEKKPLVITLKDVSDYWYLWVNDLMVNPIGISGMWGKDISYLVQPSDLVKLSLNSSKVVNITFLSSLISVEHFGANFDHHPKGLYSARILVDKKDVTLGDWIQQPAMKGEYEKIFCYKNAKYWESNGLLPIFTPLTWYKITIPSLKVIEIIKDSGSPIKILNSTHIILNDFISFSLKLNEMGKGQIYVNGNLIGRYWDENSGYDCKDCEWDGPFNSDKCRIDCGSKSQGYYHVPMDMIFNEGRIRDLDVVLFEESGGDPRMIELVMVL